MAEAAGVTSPGVVNAALSRWRPALRRVVPVDEQPAQAVRIDWDSDAFDLAEAYDHVTTIEIASGRLAISDPAYIEGGGLEIVVDVAPGSWIVETVHEMKDKAAGFRLRQVPGD
jgi:hypothetical protein